MDYYCENLNEIKMVLTQNPMAHLTSLIPDWLQKLVVLALNNL